MVTIKIKRRINTECLLQKEREEKDPRVSERIRAIRLYKTGDYSKEAVANILGRTV